MAEKDSSVNRASIHMIFKGSPGTGKTAVARIFAKILKDEGVLRKGFFYEIQGRDLCGRYVGETAPKTSAYCRDAYGSVLFIDEAYSLAAGGQNSYDYGREAVATLVSEMENHRDDFCVIMAGYSKEMKELMDTNRGLASRFSYEIEFPNYTRDELAQIFMSMMEGRFQWEEGLDVTVQEFFQKIPDSVLEDENFGNARTVRNLFERTWGKAAYSKHMNGESELVIRKQDFEDACREPEYDTMIHGIQTRSMGF